MGIGHFAVGLALKRADTRINAGSLVFAAFLADFLLGVFVLIGAEQFHVPSEYATRHYLTFTFPYSHGLLGSMVWTAVAALCAALAWPRRDSRARVAMVVAIAVFSHFSLDLLVHVPELPIAGPNSYKMGLGFWNHLALELGLEVAMLIIGLAIYLRCTRADAKLGWTLGRYGMALFALLMTVMMVSGQAASTSAPGPSALIGSWIISPLAFGAIVSWLDRKRMGLPD